jgi:hypothetical protein
MKVFFRIVGWIIRIILILGVLLAGYLAYQNFFNDTQPKEALDVLMNTSEQWIQNISNTVSETVQVTTTTVSSWPQACYQDDCYTVEVVDTPQTRQRWLMFREELASDAWMLFVFETPSNYNFRMKNTKLSLDMIWLDKDYKILYINQNTPPCIEDPCPSYGPRQAQALYVLEVNGWEASNWVIGESVEIENL